MKKQAFSCFCERQLSTVFLKIERQKHSKLPKKGEKWARARNDFSLFGVFFIGFRRIFCLEAMGKKLYFVK